MRRTLILLFLFATAMGFMESAIVIYLRALYYPGGFQFPLTVIPANIATVEILREAATIIMLFIIGYIAGKNSFQRFCLFLFSFAVWDLFYYIFLKIFLGWPESLFTWDILFLIPVPWVGPVIAPCILSLTMIAITTMMVWNEKKNIQLIVRRSEWHIFIAGSLITITSFVWDYLFMTGNSGSVLVAANGQNLFTDFMNYIPKSFNWPLFIAGETLLILGTIRVFFKRVKT